MPTNMSALDRMMLGYYNAPDERKAAEARALLAIARSESEIDRLIALGMSEQDAENAADDAFNGCKIASNSDNSSDD
jgi:hypothetical protein